MDTNLLRSWLGLPPGPWPPGDRELLGLRGTPDPAAAERRALELMGVLRPHQLRHPDLVTEGMNRIAQALLVVTAFGSAPPAPPSPPAVAPAPRGAAPPSVPAPMTVEPPRPVRPVAPPPQAEPTILDAEVLDAEVVEPVAEPMVPLPELPRPVSRAAKRLPVENAEPIPLPVEDVGPNRPARRAAYAELAALRGLRRAWDKCGPFVGDPSESLPTPGHICEFLEAVQDLRAAVRHPALPEGLLAEAAPLVDVVMRQPLVLATFRALTHSQRLQLARDWAVGRATFADQYAQLRVRIAESRPARDPSRQFREFGDTLAHNPEWVLIAGSLMLVGLALLRSMG